MICVSDTLYLLKPHYVNHMLDGYITCTTHVCYGQMFDTGDK